MGPEVLLAQAQRNGHCHSQTSISWVRIQAQATLPSSKSWEKTALGYTATSQSSCGGHSLCRIASGLHVSWGIRTGELPMLFSWMNYYSLLKSISSRKLIIEIVPLSFSYVSKSFKKRDKSLASITIQEFLF